jgi:Trk K+ transport system NAD-binding subunit
VRDVATLLADSNIQVLLADSNWGNISAARRAGLPSFYGNMLTEGSLDEIELKLDGVGRFLALTPNDEVNALATVHFQELFDRAQMFQLPPQETERDRRRRGIPQHLHGRFLFRADATHAFITSRIEAGAVIKRTRLTKEFDWAAFGAHYGESALPLFIIKESGDLVVVTAGSIPDPKPGQTVISLVDDTE